jgi:hypothetical protein
MVAEEHRPSGRSERESAASRHTTPQNVRELLASGRLNEDDVLALAAGKDLPAEALKAIAEDKHWSESRRIRLALAGNPKTPISVSLSIVRRLRIFDVADLARNRFIPAAFRRKVEAVVIEHMPGMPLGHKKTLAKTAGGDILLKLLHDAEQEVVRLCLGNPHLHEGGLFKLIAGAESRPETIRMIAESEKWSCRRLLRYALIRNPHTPTDRSEAFLQSMTLSDIRGLSVDPSLPDGVAPLVLRELRSRDRKPGARACEQRADDEDALEDSMWKGANDDAL